jgi:hypothetical protein
VNPLSLAQSAKRILLSLVTVSLLLQGLFPSGYMPGNLASGWVAVLCPQGLPAAFVQQLNTRLEALGGHAHHHHGSHESDHPEMPSPEGSCQLGSALEQPAVAGQVQAANTADTVVSLLAPPPVLLVWGGVLLAPKPRGPPIV